MELWIRSQNKHRLIKANELQINLSSSYIFCNGMCIGMYDTEERAIEILNEIQSKIANLFICKPRAMVTTEQARKMKDYLDSNCIGDVIMADSTMDIEPINQNVVVYQMPEE